VADEVLQREGDAAEGTAGVVLERRVERLRGAGTQLRQHRPQCLYSRRVHLCSRHLARLDELREAGCIVRGVLVDMHP
jgi:hypothetical protein